jgi:hypothetical protein
MAEYTGEVIYEQVPQVKTKPKINPALANALVPQNAPVSMPVAPVVATPSVALSPQDQRSFALSEANRIAVAKQKQAEEAAQEKNPTGAPTEGERTAATLLQRLQFSQQQLKDALAEDQTAAKPQFLPSVVSKFSESAANSMRSPVRQRIEGAQLDLLDAALTLGTGAAYTKEQLKGYSESYFPQIGDSPQAIKDKEARLANVIEAAKIKAGRAAKLVPEIKTGNKPPAGAPTDVKQAPDGKWYSPDPKRPGKYLMWGE